MEENNNMNVQQTPPSIPTANNFAIPFAIVVAGIAIAAALYFGDSGTGNVPVGTKESAQDIVLKPVDSSDHMLGNPNAPVIIVEYSDFECVFCKLFHPTMHQVMSTFGKDGEVAWVYRHFATGRFSKSKKEAEASECAAKQGGNIKFWEYTNKIFEITPSSNGLDLALLPKIAKDIGLDVQAFNTCLESGEMAANVDEDLASGEKALVTGTPHSLIVVAGKVVGVIGGAQPFEMVKSEIEKALKLK